MSKCTYCGSELPDNADFCGNCGRVHDRQAELLTHGGGIPVANPPSLPPNYWQGQSQSGYNAPTSMSEPGWGNPGQRPMNSNPWQGVPQQSMPGNMLPPQTNEQEDEEERRKRAALLGFGLMGGIGEGARMGGNAPMVQGTPQLGNMPVVQGTPHLGGGTPFAPGGGAGVNVNPPPMSGGGFPAPHPVSPNPPPVPKPKPQPTGGCAPIWLIAILVPVLLIVSIIGAGFTLFAPTLSWTGNLVPGGTIQLQGSDFLPGSNVTLTLDGSTPLYFSSQVNVSRPVAGLNDTALALNALQMPQRPAQSNVALADGSGKFRVNITIGQDWQAGQHTIKASEGGFSPRSALLTLMLNQSAVTQTPTPSPGVTPVGLSCLKPTNLTLGPVSEGYTGTVSKVVTLCSTGTGIINWTATWDHNQAPWLQVTPDTGQMTAPGEQNIQVSATANSLNAGTYTATVTFTSQQSDLKQTLTITFTVAIACVSAQPVELSFTGVAGVSDPKAQVVTLSNCGSAAEWSSSITTSNNGNWLGLSATNGALDAKATQQITVTVSSISAQLAAGSYTGQIIFSIGSQQATVNVLLTVQEAPTLVLNSPNPPVFNTSPVVPGDCSYPNSATFTGYICIASISNSSKTTSLTWTASSTGPGGTGVTFKPSTGSYTLDPGQTVRVQIFVPANSCGQTTNILFTGPANTLTIAWQCNPNVIQ